MKIIPFERSFASHPRSKYWSKKNDINPIDVTICSERKVWFDCEDCGHSFQTTAASVSHTNSWCSYCGNKQLCNNKDCKFCFDKSFASHQKSTYWSKKNNKQPSEVFRYSGAKYWFDCDKCDHYFEICLYSIIMNDSWCPYCAHRKICLKYDCKHCFDMSFASHERAKYWSKKNDKFPREVFKHSDKKYWFCCNKCVHEFYTCLFHIISKDVWCTYCSNQKLCDDVDCSTCLNKSFDSHDKAKYWSKKNHKNPRDVFRCSSKKYLFDCEVCGNEFEVNLSRIIHENGWCPFCVNKTERKLHEFLKIRFPNIKKEYAPKWLYNPETKRTYRFDFYIPELKIIIELDGLQHFEQVSTWKTPEEQQARDIYKTKCANENGLSVIRLFQKEVYEKSDKFLEEMLLPHLKLHELPMNLFISSNEELYNQYKLAL